MHTPSWKQFRLEREDGLIIERLPLGRADGRWYVTFVCTGIDFTPALRKHEPSFYHSFGDLVTLSGVDSEIVGLGGGGGGTEAELQWRGCFDVGEATALRITYLDGAQVLCEEVLDVTRIATD